MMPQITSLSGIQLVQRGKKLAMGYHANAVPLDITSHHNKSMLNSECAAFRRSKGLRFSLRLRGNQDSINLSGGSKIKFIIQFQADKKRSPFPILKSEQLAKTHQVKSSAARQARKRDIRFNKGSCQSHAARFSKHVLWIGHVNDDWFSSWLDFSLSG